MSWVTEDEFKERQAVATPDSPLAAFEIGTKGERKPRMVDVVFANTVAARKRIAAGEGFIGIFHNSSQDWAEKLAEVLEA